MTLLRFRRSNYDKLSIKTGRWNSIPRNRRFCNICKNNIGDKCHYLWSVQSWKNIEKSVYHQCILNDQILKIIFIKKLAVIINLCFINIIIKRASSPVWCVQYMYTLAFCIILSVLYISLCCFIKCENKWIEMNWTAGHEFKSTSWLLTISTELIFFFENQNFPPI